MDQVLVGFDLDGVIASDFPLPKISKWMFNWIPNLWACIIYSTAKCLRKPSGKFVIVTGRPEVDREITLRWLKKYSIEPEQVIMAKEPRNGAGHKTEIINQLGITTFYESDLTQALQLQYSCPKCTVILVYDNTNIKDAEKWQSTKTSWLKRLLK